MSGVLCQDRRCSLGTGPDGTGHCKEINDCFVEGWVYSQVLKMVMVMVEMNLKMMIEGGHGLLNHDSRMAEMMIVAGLFTASNIAGMPFTGDPHDTRRHPTGKSSFSTKNFLDLVKTLVVLPNNFNL